MGIEQGSVVTKVEIGQLHEIMTTWSRTVILARLVGYAPIDPEIQVWVRPFGKRFNVRPGELISATPTRRWK